MLAAPRPSRWMYRVQTWLRKTSLFTPAEDEQERLSQDSIQHLLDAPLLHRPRLLLDGWYITSTTRTLGFWNQLVTWNPPECTNIIHLKGRSQGGPGARDSAMAGIRQNQMEDSVVRHSLPSRKADVGGHDDTSEGLHLQGFLLEASAP